MHLSLWLFFILASLQPVVQRHMLPRRVGGQPRGIAKKRDATVITLIHRQETLSLLGIPARPVHRYRRLRERAAGDPQDTAGPPIVMILHTPGRPGARCEPDRAGARDHDGKVTAVVPHYAMSGGTLIALGGGRDRDRRPRGARSGRSAARPVRGRLARRGGGGARRRMTTRRCSSPTSAARRSPQVEAFTAPAARAAHAGRACGRRRAPACDGDLDARPSASAGRAGSARTTGQVGVGDEERELMVLIRSRADGCPPSSTFRGPRPSGRECRDGERRSDGEC